jgi:putative glutamine amidotransferase
MHHPPLVGITCSLDEREARVRRAYLDAVRAAGGLPVLIAPAGAHDERDAADAGDAAAGFVRTHDGQWLRLLPSAAERDEVAALLERLDAVVLTGGDDPRTEPFGQPTDPRTSPILPARQRFEIALIEALRSDPAHSTRPVLGICLGMQLMALAAGGALNQWMPGTVPTHDRHRGDTPHPIVPEPGLASWCAAGVAASHHRQAVSDPGSMRVVARADDGVIEAIDCPHHPHCRGVQWHPERTADPRLGAQLFVDLVASARAMRADRLGA